jgi:hypothetical protein
LWIQLDSTRSKVRTARTYPTRYHKLDHFLIFSRGSIPTKIKPIFLSPARLSFFPRVHVDLFEDLSIWI